LEWLGVRSGKAYIPVARENERVRGRRDVDVIVAWAIVVTHHCQVLDDFSCLGLVEAPHHTIFAQLNISCIGLDHELMSYSVVLELSVPRSSAFLSAVRKVVTTAPSMAKAEGKPAELAAFS
jgi:hypothetical protein